MTEKWTSLEEVLQRRPVDRRRVARQRRQMIAESRAYRLAELRKAASITQQELASRLNIDQSGVSRLERGNFETTEVGTLSAFIKALGGTLQLTARFGDEVLVLVDYEVSRTKS